MTVTTRNNHPRVTDGDDARVRVRAPEPARALPVRPDATRGSAHARAVPDTSSKVKSGGRSKVRDFASQHAGEAQTSLAASWLGSGRPQNLATVAKQLRSGNPAAVFRLAVYTIAYLLCAAVDTNKRAAVAFGLLVLSLLAAWAISAFAGT